MKLVTLSVVSLFCFFDTSFSQNVLRSVSPETEAISSERLKQLDVNINQWIKEEQLNGATMIILRNGKIIYYKAFGFANKNIPMRTDNIFRIASMTKPIISVAAMMLYEEGKFLLTDPVSKFRYLFYRVQS